MDKNDIKIEINEIKDDPNYIEKTVDLIYKVLLTRGPLIEVLTIIKFEKPRLFTYLKKRLNTKHGFNFLFEMIADYDFAKRSLGL